MEYKIENEFLEAVVCSKGCELVSVKTKKDGAEHIWQGNPDFIGVHCLDTISCCLRFA